MAAAAAAALVVLLAATAAGPASAGDPFAYYDWNVRYKTVAPLGVEQQVHFLILQKKKSVFFPPFFVYEICSKGYQGGENLIFLGFFCSFWAMVVCGYDLFERATSH